jgi:hypothetical protein
MVSRPCIPVGLAPLGAVCAVLAFAAAPAAAEECPNAAFRVGPSSRLPDCRAYEMVTPPYKADGFRGGGSFGGSFLLSPDGSSLGFGSFSAIAGAEGFTDTFNGGARYGARRTAAGWVTAAEELPASRYQVYVYAGVVAQLNASLDAHTGVYAAREVGQAENRVDLYLRRAGGSVVDVGPALPPSAPSGSLVRLWETVDLFAVGLSADGSRLLFDLSRYFWPGDGTEEAAGGNENGVFHSLYEYLGAGNTAPLLVGVDSSGKQISECGTVLGAGSPTGSAGNGLIDSSHNAISADGNTVFFTAPFGTSGSALRAFGCKSRKRRSWAHRRPALRRPAPPSHRARDMCPAPACRASRAPAHARPPPRRPARHRLRRPQYRSIPVV